MFAKNIHNARIVQIVFVLCVSANACPDLRVYPWLFWIAKFFARSPVVGGRQASHVQFKHRRSGPRTKPVACRSLRRADGGVGG